MSTNLLAYGPDQIISAGFLRSKGGELRSGRMAVKFEDYADGASIGGPLATFHDYYVVNPNDPRTFTRNGFQLAESRESTLIEMRTFPVWASEPTDKVRALLDLQSPMMTGSSMSMCFLPLHDVSISQESRNFLNYPGAAFMYFQTRPSHSPVYIQNVLEAACYVLAVFYGNTTFEVETQLDQKGGQLATPFPVRAYVSPGAFWARTVELLDQKYWMAQAQLLPKGADAIAESMATAVLAYSQWDAFTTGLPKTIRLTNSTQDLITIKYLMELVMAMRPVTSLESVLPLYGPGATYVDAEAIDKAFDALEYVYSKIPTVNARHIPLAYRYLVRGGNQRQYTIAGTPEYTRVEYKPSKAVRIGGRNIPVVVAHYNLLGAGGVPFRYTNPVIAPSLASTAFRTTVKPEEIVLAISQPLDLVYPGVAPGAATDARVAADYVDAIRIVNEQLHDQFYLPRNWTAKHGVASTVIGGVHALLSGHVPGITDIIPLNGAKIADAGEVKASIPLRDYSLRITSGDHVKTIGNPVIRWTREIQSRLAGYWAPFPSDQQEVGTGWYVR